MSLTGIKNGELSPSYQEDDGNTKWYKTSMTMTNPPLCQQRANRLKDPMPVRKNPPTSHPMLEIDHKGSLVTILLVWWVCCEMVLGYTLYKV